MRKPSGALAAALLLLGSAGSAEPLGQAANRGSGFGAGQAAAVDALLSSRHRADSPGCAVGVYRGGTMVHSGAFGMANLEFDVPITTRTAFDIGSTSKQFTAASLVLLAEEGKLSLDEDVRKHLPEMPNYGTRMTVRQLLNHTSGLRDYNGLLSMAGFHRGDVTTTDEALALIVRQKRTNFVPGTQHLYSNSGHFLASVILQRATGQPLREFARQRIFEPLGMRSTVFRDDHRLIVPQRAVGYSPSKGNGYRIDVSNWEQVGDGGLLTTVEDLAKWAANLESGTVGGKALVDALHTRSALSDGSAIDYTIGLQHGTDRGRAFVEHGGRWGGYVSHFRSFPDHRLAVAALCNNAEAPALELVQSVGDIYLGSPSADAVEPLGAEQMPVISLSDAQLDAWMGEYRDMESGQVVSISREAGTLKAQGGGPTFTLRPVGPARFAFIDGPVGAFARFEAAAGEPRTMSVFFGDKLFQKLRAVPRIRLSREELARYAGAYQCSEIDAVQRVDVDDGALVVRRPRSSSSRFLPWERGVFHGEDSVTLTFAGDAAGRPVSFRIDTPRVRGVQCDRLD